METANKASIEEEAKVESISPISNGSWWLEVASCFGIYLIVCLVSASDSGAWLSLAKSMLLLLQLLGLFRSWSVVSLDIVTM